MNAGPGDLVVCVDAGPCRCGDCGGLPAGVEVGRTYRVLDVVPAIYAHAAWIAYDVGLPWDGWHDGTAVGARRFRKLNDEPDNAELIALIKRPVRKGVRA